jgi:hypothetical protein
MTAARPDGAAMLPALVVDDCWNRIGVRGDASCPELKHQVHCRNCPTHSAAASALLRRELPVGYRADWAGHFARRQEVEDPGTESAMIFRVGTEWLALPALVFEEVAELGAIHSLPHRRSGLVLGLTNVRGELLICFSLTKLLVLVGQKKAVAIAVRNVSGRRRGSKFSEWLASKKYVDVPLAGASQLRLDRPTTGPTFLR